jgi:hypothetical protein
METITCPVCGFTDTYDPDESGLTYYQAVGTCPICDADLGTKIVVEYRVGRVE